jgi:hypothetical protein
VELPDRQPATATHRAYSVIRREGQDDYRLNIGLVFPHKDASGFNLILQAFRSTARPCAARLSRTMRRKPRPRLALGKSRVAALGADGDLRAPLRRGFILILIASACRSHSVVTSPQNQQKIS